MKVAGYIRVSTEEQKRNGWNLEADRRRIEEIAETNRWELVDIFDDGGRQGDDPDRPGFNAMLDALGQLDVIIMRSLDRLSRDTFLYALATKAIRAADVTVHTFNGPVDLDTPEGELATNVLAAIARFEKRQTGVRVRQSVQARARNGRHVGRAPYGYRFDDKRLVVVPDEAEIVKRIFADYTSGMGQRAIVRALNDDMVPTRQGGPWHQSRITKILNSVVYTGKIEHRGTILDGAHEPIVPEQIWHQAEAIRTDAHRRKGGRHPDGSHLLTRGILKCPRCSSAMIPRKARPGVERERYVCGGRIERGPEFCSQPSIRRELIDEPFLAHLLDGYIDLDATVKRIEERTASALTLARDAVAEREAEVVRIERALAMTERDYDEGDITGRQYGAREARLTEELEGAKNALQRSQEHVHEVGQTGLVGDAEQVLLDHLAALKRTVAAGASAAPNPDGLRNVVGQMFDSVQLVRAGGWPPAAGEGFVPFDGDVPRVEGGGRRYWLLLTLRWSAVDVETFKPIGQAIPVPEWQSYPQGFFSRYCWW